MGLADIFTFKPPPPVSTEDKYLAQRRARGASSALLGLPDLFNTAINAGIRDVGSLTGLYDPNQAYQFSMPSQAAANLATELSGATIVPPEAVSPAVQKKGANQEALMGLLPTPSAPETLALKGLAAIAPVAKKTAPLAETLSSAVKPAATQTFKHPISGVKLRTPIEEMETTFVPFGEMRSEKLLHPESLLGSTIIPMRGDPARAGQTLTHIGGRQLETPVDMHGGPGFARMQSNIDKGVGWASQPAPAATLANRAKNIEGPVKGVYQKMGERSTAYNTMLADTLHQMFKLDRPKIAQADIDEFDRIMREVPLQVNKKTGKAERPAYPDWPGLENLTPEYIRKGSGPKGDGKVRNKMFDLMDSKYWQDRGFPNTGYANYAVTDPKLLNTPTHTSGASVVTFDPAGGTVDNVGHPTYSRGIKATEEGVLPELPLDVLYEGYQATGGKGGKPIPNSQLEKFLATKPPSLLVDQQVVDRVMKYLRTQDGAKWGLGGAVTAGLISQEQADEMDPNRAKGSAL